MIQFFKYYLKFCSVAWCAPLSACRSVLGQDAEPQTPEHRFVNVCVNGYRSRWSSLPPECVCVIGWMWQVLFEFVLNYLSHPERICSNLPFLTWMHTEILSRNAHKLKCQTSVSNRNVLFPSHKVFVAALNSLYDHLEPSFGYHDDLVSISPSTSATMRPIHISSFVCVINTFTVSLTFIQLQWATWSVFMVFKKHGSK